MRKVKTIKCWGIPYGNTTSKDQIEEWTIEMRCRTIKEFKEICEQDGHKLTGKPYVSK